jgi:hypothetical protein
MISFAALLLPAATADRLRVFTTTPVGGVLVARSPQRAAILSTAPPSPTVAVERPPVELGLSHGPEILGGTFAAPTGPPSLSGRRRGGGWIRPTSRPRNLAGGAT